MTECVQHALDDLARKNSWQVNSAPGKSVYTRGGETVTVQFNQPGTTVTGAVRTMPLDINAKDLRGQVSNILRHRWRTFESADGNL